MSHANPFNLFILVTLLHVDVGLLVFVLFKTMRGHKSAPFTKLTIILASLIAFAGFLWGDETVGLIINNDIKDGRITDTLLTITMIPLCRLLWCLLQKNRTPAISKEIDFLAGVVGISLVLVLGWRLGL